MLVFLFQHQSKLISQYFLLKIIQAMPIKSVENIGSLQDYYKENVLNKVNLLNKLNILIKFTKIYKLYGKPERN